VDSRRKPESKNMDQDQSKTETPAAVHSNDEFCIGQDVTWMHCSSNGRSLGFSTREGKIKQLGNKAAFVKRHRSGKTEWVSYENLTPAGDKNAVTKLFEGMAGQTIGETLNKTKERK
jgi:hypothetical protein